MRVLRVQMSDGSKWDVPVKVIAEHYANHYATPGTPQHLEDLTSIERDDSMLIGWSRDRMNWADVKEHATLVPPETIAEDELQYGWTNGKREVVEK